MRTNLLITQHEYDFSADATLMSTTDVGVIDGIALQTNSLALNAPVEAACVSEQGWGSHAAVARLDQMTQQNATLVVQSATSTPSLQARADRLLEAVAVFRLSRER